MDRVSLSFTYLPTGYVHIRGDGPCEWAQPPRWPCSDEELESSFLPEASERFRAALREHLSVVREREAEVGR